MIAGLFHFKENFLPLGRGVGVEAKQYDGAKEEVSAAFCG